MRAKGLGALLLHHLPTIRYLSGFSGSNALVLLAERSAVLATDPRYDEQSRAEVQGMRIVVPADGLLPNALARESLFSGAPVLGLEFDRLTHAQFRHLKRLLPAVTFKDASGMADAMRAIKSDDEVSCIRFAARITDAVFSELIGLLKPGMTELDVAAEITYRQRRNGADRDSFEPIVVSGPRSALIHGSPTSRRLRVGDTLLLDFGCVARGYCSDLTRTVAIGRASRALVRMHAAVHDAHARALAAATPGMAARELDLVARTAIEEHGFGGAFTHALGHGLGLEVHELPRISWRATDMLREGMVFTIEPGVYVTGVGGVRIEDDVLLQNSGATPLTQSPRGLIVVPA